MVISKLRLVKGGELMSETVQGLILVIIFSLVNWGLYVYRGKMTYNKKTYYTLMSPDDFTADEKEV